MYEATLKQHRHYTKAGKVKSLHYKMVFNNPDEYVPFFEWIQKRGGIYDYNKVTNEDEGVRAEFPEYTSAMQKDDYCVCDLYSYYLYKHGYHFKAIHGTFKIYTKSLPRHLWEKLKRFVAKSGIVGKR